MPTQLKDMILNITLEDTRVRMYITDTNGLMIFDDGYYTYDSASMDQEYFDNWVTMISSLPTTNITQVNRFI